MGAAAREMRCSDSGAEEFQGKVELRAAELGAWEVAKGGAAGAAVLSLAPSSSTIIPQG